MLELCLPFIAILLFLVCDLEVLILMFSIDSSMLEELFSFDVRVSAALLKSPLCAFVLAVQALTTTASLLFSLLLTSHPWVEKPWSPFELTAVFLF